MRKKIAIIGDRNSVLAFKCLGVEVFTPDQKVVATKVVVTKVVATSASDPTLR